MASHVFTKRSGTSDQGHDFEYYFIANLLLKLITDDDVEDFFLSSDDNDYGSFDDVVVEMVDRSGHRQIYAIQLKHFQDKKKIVTVAALESYDRGVKRKFAIENYNKFKFQNDYTAVILYTNASLEATTDGQVLNLENFEQTKIWKTSKPKSILTTSENGEFYYLETENSTDFRNFCKHFSLYTNQANVTQLEQQTRDLFEKLFGCKGSAFTEYVNFIIKWCKKEGEKEKLTKEWIRNVIAVCILKPFVRPLSFSSREVNENTKILREAISLFQTTVFDSGCYEKVRELWSDFKQEFTDVEKINMKYSVTSDSIQSVDDLDGKDKETSIMLWLLGKCPLILADAPEVYRAIEVFKEKKFVICNPKILLQSKTVFKKLSDLEKCSRIYDNIMNRLTCSVQGKKEVTLKNFFHGCQGVGEILTTNELLQMVDGPLIIGGGMEMLPACHNPRRILKNIVNIKYLEQLKNGAWIVIDNFCGMTDSGKDEQFTTIKEFLKTKFDGKNEIYLCKGKCPRADVEEICQITNNTNYYHFRYLTETLVEYINSSNVDGITCFTTKKHFHRECELYQNDNDINIISGNPGMGKSTLMKNLKNNIPSSLWTVLVYARNYGDYFKKNKTNIDDFLNHCLIETGKNISIFEQNVIRLLLLQRRFVILWDGLDEMVEANLEIVKKIIHDANSQGYKQWITSRNHLKSTLEDEFNTLSRSLEEFDEKEQKIYIGERLNLVGEAVDDIFTKIQKNIALSPNNNILGIPLQSFMLTELFLQDKDKYLSLLNEIFSVADLYEHFVDEKFNVYYKEKQNLVEINEVLRERNEEDKKLMVNIYEVAAIHTYFDKTIVSDLQTESQKLSFRPKKDPVGFIIETANDGLSEFCHNSFGEYFAALFLTKNNKNFFVAFDLLLARKYDNIRFFYDLMLAKGCKGHIAVLYRNYELLTTCTDDEICKTDQLGRSTLEVACTWRKKFPLLSVSRQTSANFPCNYKILYDDFWKKSDVLIVNDRFLSANTRNFQKIVSLLVSCLQLQIPKCDLFSDTYLVLPFVSLTKKDVTRFFEMGTKHIVSVLLYAVALDFAAILDLFRNIPFFYYKPYVDSWSLQNLVTVGIKFRSLNCLKKLFFDKFYAFYLSKNAHLLYKILRIFQINSLFETMIDVVRHVKIFASSRFAIDTLLHRACYHDDYKVAKFLIENGASVNHANKYGDLLLIEACKNGDDNMVKLFVDNQSKLIEDVNTEVAPLKRAVEANSEEVVNFLLKIGVPLDETQGGEICIREVCNQRFYIIARLLIAYKASLKTNEWELMPIHYAIVAENCELLTLLIENGADVNVKDNEGNTPLHLACESYKLTKILIDNGVDLSAVNNIKLSVVHLISDSKILNLLIKKGVNLHSQDRNGRTVMHYVCSNERHYPADFFDILLQNDIDKDSESLNKNKKRKSLINKKDNNGKTPLHYACLTNNCSLELVKDLIKNGSDPNLIDRYKKTPLHYVCTSKQENVFEVVSILIEGGAVVNIPDREGKLPLHYACICGQLLSVVNLLVENNPEIMDVADGGGKLPIHYACIFDHIEDVKVCLEKGVDVNVLDKKRRSPLHYACENNHIDIVKLLVATGANTNIKDKKGKTPLFYANLEVSRFLIENTPSNVNVVDNGGFTLLRHSSLNRNYEYVKLLLENGTKFDRCNKGKMLIHYACSFGRLEDVKLCLEEDVDVNVLDKERKTPLHYACENDRFDVVGLLVANEANTNIKDVNGKTPLFYSKLEVSRFLIENTTADVNVADNDGFTLLHHSSINRTYEYVKLLLENGAKIHIADDAGRLAIHYACRNKYGYDVIKVLTQFGASINVVDHNGKLPLHHACISGSERNVILLIELGASVNAPDKFERTPLHYSSAYGHVEISEILLEHGSSVNFSDKDKKLPIHYACLRVHREISKFPNSSGFSFEEISSYNSCWGCREEAEEMANKHELQIKTYHFCEQDCYKTVRLLLKYKSRTDDIDNKGKMPADYSREYCPKVVKDLINGKN